MIKVISFSCVLFVICNAKAFRFLPEIIQLNQFLREYIVEIARGIIFFSLNMLKNKGKEDEDLQQIIDLHIAHYHNSEEWRPYLYSFFELEC